MSRRITKKEKQGMLFALFGVVVFAFFTDPITNAVSKFFPNTTTRIIVGLILVFVIAYYGKSNEVLR